MNPVYPIALRLEGRPIVVVGGGAVAYRKARGLVAAGAVVTAVATSFAPAFRRLPANRTLASFRAAHLRGAALVFAATDNSAVNAAVARAARARGIPVNIADDPRGSDFHLPAVVRRGAVTVAVSTGGASPALARRLRIEIGKWLGRDVARLAESARKLRETILGSDLPAPQRRALLRSAGRSLRTSLRKAL